MTENNEANEPNKVTVILDRDVVQSLLEMKRVGDSYSDVIRRLMKHD